MGIFGDRGVEHAERDKTRSGRARGVELVREMSLQREERKS
jgi:hypothetical protein